MLGGDALVCTADESIENRVAALTENRGVPFALDAMGGAVGMAVVRALAPGGRMLVYGILSGEPVPLDGLALIVGQKAVEGFLLSDWARRQSPLPMLLLFRRISRLLRKGVLATEVGASHPLEQIQEAVRHAEAPGRRGKVLLRISSA